jgi:hypothetical protein
MECAFSKKFWGYTLSNSWPLENFIFGGRIVEYLEIGRKCGGRCGANTKA